MKGKNGKYPIWDQDFKTRMWIKFSILVLLMIPGIFSGYCQSLTIDGEMKRWEGGADFGLDNDGFELDLRGLWFLNQYFGLKLGLGCAGELWTLEDWNRTQEWPPSDYTFDHTYALRLRFNPALALRSPALVELKNWDATLHLFAEPGVIVSPGSSGSSGARVFCWAGKAGINMQIGRYVATLGYGISDFSLYSGSPDSYQGQPVKKDYITHTVFVGFAVKFGMTRKERRPRVPSPYEIDGMMLP